jgi:hypothetical protein
MNGWKRLAPLAIALLTPDAAQSERLFLAGAELANTAYYGYAGLVLPGPGHSGERGWLQRYWIDAFGYEYDGAPGRVEAEAYGLEASLGYSSSSERGWASAWVGLRYTDTDLSPDDPTATARGSQTGFKFQLDGERRFADTWRVGGIASYSTQQNGYWARGRLLRSMGSGSALGAEIVAGGNDEADYQSVGAVFEHRPDGGSWSLAVKLGYRFQDEDDSVYGGLELGRSF